METTHKVSIIITLIAIAIMDCTSTFGQRTVTNPHDFNLNGSWTITERCNPCHVISGESNKDDKFEVVYERDTLTKADSTYISSTSKLCFTCHDGAVATFTHVADGDIKISGIGMKNHPVSVVYDYENTNVSLFNPNEKKSGLGSTIAEDLLSNGRIECTSCHDAHFSTAKIACSSCPQVLFTSGSSDGSSSLWMENNKSSLCLICHKL